MQDNGNSLLAIIFRIPYFTNYDDKYIRWLYLSETERDEDYNRIFNEYSD